MMGSSSIVVVITDAYFSGGFSVSYSIGSSSTVLVTVVVFFSSGGSIASS